MQSENGAQDAIASYLETLGICNAPSVEEFISAVDSAMKDRSIIYCYIWRTIRELHPDIDASEIMREAALKFGKYKGAMLNNLSSAGEVMKRLSSKTGYLLFEQEFKALGDSYAQKDFSRCPHLEAWREMGCTEDEISALCLDMISYGDYGMLDQHKLLRLEFKQQLSKGDPVCSMCISKIDGKQS